MKEVVDNRAPRGWTRGRDKAEDLLVEDIHLASIATLQLPAHPEDRGRVSARANAQPEQVPGGHAIGGPNAPAQGGEAGPQHSLVGSLKDLWKKEAQLWCGSK